MSERTLTISQAQYTLPDSFPTWTDGQCEIYSLCLSYEVGTTMNNFAQTMELMIGQAL